MQYIYKVKKINERQVMLVSDRWKNLILGSAVRANTLALSLARQVTYWIVVIAVIILVF